MYTVSYSRAYIPQCWQGLRDYYYCYFTLTSISMTNIITLAITSSATTSKSKSNIVVMLLLLLLLVVVVVVIVVALVLLLLAARTSRGSILYRYGTL